MATLEKIRSKSVLLFTIIIVALLAFILGDFLTSGRNLLGPGDTVASANGAKVSFTEYQTRLNQKSEAQKNSQQQMDNDVLSQQTIDELLVEALLNQEYDKMGITVTDKQLSSLMLGAQTGGNVFQNLMGQFGQAAAVLYQKGIVDARTYYDAMQNPAKYGLQPEDADAMKGVWSSLEQNIDQSIKSQAYGVLIQGLFTANQVDAKAMYDDRNTTTHFAYVRKDLSSVADGDVKPTDEDYKKVYDEHKGAFLLNEETRAVSYIVVPILPSDADYAKGQSEVETVIAQLNATEGTSALSQHPDFVSQNMKLTRADLAKDAQLRSLVADSVGITAGTARATQMAGGNYTIAKVLDVTTGIDKLKVSTFAGPAAEIDSVLAKTTVATFDSIARANGGNAGVELSLVNPGAGVSEKIIAALSTRPVGEVFTLTDTITGQDDKGKAMTQTVKQAFLISEREAPVAVYDIAKVTYSVVPSAETVRDLNAKFHAFVANNAEAEAFNANAEKSGYQVGKALVSPSTPLLGNAPSRRGAVKWAMDNKKGKVSPVFSQTDANDYLMAVAVDDIYDGEYLPVTSTFVRDYLRPQVMNNLKAEKLIKQYAGKAKDLKGYSALMGAPVANADAVFGEDQIPGVGFGEFLLQGEVAGAKKGQLVGPFQGTNAVYVITVNGADKQGRPYDFKENATVFGQKISSQLSANTQSLLRLLSGDNKVQNNILKFTPDQVN